MFPLTVNHVSKYCAYLRNISRQFTLQQRVACRRASSPIPIPAEVLESRRLLAASGVQALHRSGQTFVTWQEDVSVEGESYHIYRHNAPITPVNLSQAQKLTGKWGPLADDTSAHKLGGEHVPSNFVIHDLGQPLSDEEGLFVHTTGIGQSGTWHYAVTQVTGGVEDTTSVAQSGSVAEAVANAQPVMVASQNGGKGRIYTQFMDYAQWNPTFQGYAYNYAIALPDNYDPAVEWPLKLEVHAHSEEYKYLPQSDFDWPSIQVFVDDPGADDGTVQTWWYGFSADHNYLTDGAIPTSGNIENFTEQRVLRAVDEVITNFSVDTSRIHAQGHSMGGSGSISLGMRYGDVFAGIYASEGMTNYAASPTFQVEFEQIWGTQSSNLPVVSAGPHATQLQSYNGTGVYDWMNHQQQVINRRGDDMAFLMFGHGKEDDVIDWATQGQPFVTAVNAARVGFTAEVREDWGHNWMGFSFANHDLFSREYGDLGEWIFQSNFSFPGISNASGSGTFTPGNTGTEFYNLNIDWSVPWRSFDADPVDTFTHYEISLRSRDGVQTADITPRNLQQFQITSGKTYSWQNIDNSTGQVVQSGTVTADSVGLVTVTGFRIGTDTGNRLILNNEESSVPAFISESRSVGTPRPTVRWNSVPDAVSYRIWISNQSTAQNPYLISVVQDTSYTPPTHLPIGRYAFWVQANLVGGEATGWSKPLAIKVLTGSLMTDMETRYDTASPTITWKSIVGAARYEVWVNNLTTGQSAVVHETGLQETEFQLPELNLGRYRIWVRAINSVNDFGRWSPAETFSVATRTQLLSPDTSTFDTRPTLEWDEVPGAGAYRLYVYNIDSGAIYVDQHDVTGTQWTPAASMPVADYRWWVQATSATGHNGSWSRIGLFSVGGRPTVLRPSGTIGDTTPEFTWTPVDGAVRYVLHVNRLDVSRIVIREDFLTSASFVATQSLSSGTYRVWVQAVSSTGVRSAWSVPLDFTIADADSGDDSPVSELAELLTVLPLPISLPQAFLNSFRQPEAKPTVRQPRDVQQTGQLSTTGESEAGFRNDEHEATLTDGVICEIATRLLS